MTEWIKVENKLPDQYTRLAYIYGPNCGVVCTHENDLIFWCAERQRWRVVNLLDFEYDFKETVTHWMPRPEEPQHNL